MDCITYTSKGVGVRACAVLGVPRFHNNVACHTGVRERRVLCALRGRTAATTILRLRLPSVLVGVRVRELRCTDGMRREAELRGEAG